MRPSDFTDPRVAKTYSKTPITHPSLMWPAMLSELGNVNGKRILDMGCGPGELTEMIAEAGANVVGIDYSPVWRDAWKMRCRPEFYEMDARANLDALGKFDGVVANMLMINLAEESDVKMVLARAQKALSPGGLFVFSDLHPIGKTRLQTPTQEILDDIDYFKEGAFFRSRVQLIQGGHIEFQDTHWSLGTMTRWIRDSGLTLDHITEPRPTEISGYQVPEFIIYNCRR